MVPNLDFSVCKILRKMIHRWLLLSIVWIGYHLVNGEPQEILEDAESTDSNLIPFPYYSYLGISSPNGNENFNEIAATDTENDDQSYVNDDGQKSNQFQRKKRNTEQSSKSNNIRKRRWPSDFQEGSTQSKYYPSSWNLLKNSEETYKEKRSFSPWGGKRGQPLTNHVWSSERDFLRESSMPKRVRFSPWGGKRSGNFKLTPETNYYFQHGHIDNKDPCSKIVRTYAEFAKDSKPSHQYNDLYLKKDGKRKVKFSSWGGKRFFPIIDSIQSPDPQSVKEFLDSIVIMTEPHSNRAAATN